MVIPYFSRYFKHYWKTDVCPHIKISECLQTQIICIENSRVKYGSDYNIAIFTSASKFLLLLGEIPIWTVHWTAQLSCEQPGCWPLFIVCTVQLFNQYLQTFLLCRTDQQTCMHKQKRQHFHLKTTRENLYMYIGVGQGKKSRPFPFPARAYTTLVGLVFIYIRSHF